MTNQQKDSKDHKKQNFQIFNQKKTQFEKLGYRVMDKHNMFEKNINDEKIESNSLHALDDTH